MATHRVYFGQGEQTIRTVPHLKGRPVRVASATYGIFDARYGVDSNDHTLVAAGTAGTVDSVSTTTTARAGRNATDRRAITVASTTDVIAGRSYLLEASDGRAELVRVAAVPSATAILAAAEIVGDYPTGSALRGVEVAASFPADAADDDDNLDGMPWIIAWVFPELPPVRESIHLERGEEAQLVTLADLVELDPMIARVGGDRIEATAALARAHKDLRTDLALAGADEANLLTGPIGRDAALYLAAYHAIKHSDEASAIRRAEQYLARYQELRASLVLGVKKPEVVSLDRDNANAQTRNPASVFRSWTARG